MTDKFSTLKGKRIVHAATSANMLTAFGRVMASRMVEEGVDIYFLASSEPIYNRPANIPELTEMGGTPLTVPLVNNLRPLNIIRNIYLLWQQFRQYKPAIVHTRGSVMGIIGRISARLAGVPVIVHHQDDLHSRENQLAPWKRRLGGRIETWFANRSDHTFVVSNAVAQAAIDLGFDPARITNVGHDINQALDAHSISKGGLPRELDLLKERGINKAHFVVGSITRLEAHKGIDILVEAAAIVHQKLPNARFIVRGRGPEKDRLIGLVKRNKISDVFYIIDDWLSDEDLVALYQAFDVFVLPTKREGFGMAFAEAMLLGVVPIAPDIPPVNEVVLKHTGILVSPSSKNFADAIIWASENPEYLVKLRSAAKDEAVKRWGGTKAADMVLSTYCDLLTKKNVHR